MNRFVLHCVALICMGSISLAEPPTNEYLPPTKGYDYPKPAKPFPTTSYTPAPAPSYRPSPTYGAPTTTYQRPTPPPYRPAPAPSPTYGPAPPAPVADIFILTDVSKYPDVFQTIKPRSPDHYDEK
ncbi:hypothetical protein M8J76_005428 [Diaphorina citri]|nr:hypothetical protein M8J76_005428 [Diaphorina citri]